MNRTNREFIEKLFEQNYLTLQSKLNELSIMRKFLSLTQYIYNTTQNE